MTSTAKKRRRLLWVSIGSAPFLIVFALVLVFPLANLFSAITSLVVESEPSQAELIGNYKYSAAWGAAALNLNPDGTFRETVSEKTSSPKVFQGSWTSSRDENSAKVDFRPFGMVWDDDHGREIHRFGMNFYKRRFGNTYAKIDDDLGEEFERQ